MRVLVVTPWFPAPSSPGAGVFNLRDVELLARDHEISVLHLGGSGSTRRFQPGITVVPVPFSFANVASWRSARRSIRQHLRENDLLHTMAFPALLSFVGLSIERPWVHTEHWSGLLKSVASPAGRLGSKFLRRMLRRPDEVVAVGKLLASEVASAGARSVSIIPNFVALSDSPPIALTAETPLLLIGVGGVAEHKGVRLAVEAVNKLVRADWDVRMTWVGDGPQRQELEDEIARIGLEDRIQFVGHVEPHGVSSLLLSHNLFLLPTDFETFGVAVAEALGHGLPVVVTGDGEHVSFVPELGSRVVDRTATAIAEGIADLVRDPQRMSSAQISAYAAARFSTEARRAAYADVYQNAVRHRDA